MLKNPKISIVIPAYNSENFIKQAITSALRQSYNNIEVIVANEISLTILLRWSIVLLMNALNYIAGIELREIT